ncbi:L-rhamnose mutarotase [Paraoerskovia sediminicola]|uniref:L-rhamnose mutarotase n=1 Tax=Paraoerskovia sediminicola TaxID=1138587 RepID=A0ABN6XC75_9CELL|nr:L-rhamnose mutarotase [Paraoerskovia sediminicola]BDZ41370.1 L-rhamnose mutarotase [Paraoerskovia sediminicola]
MTQVCFVSRVRADRIDEYRAVHAAVWPEMLAALADTGWRDYRLFLADDGLLVGILQTDDFERAQQDMAAREVNDRWQAEMGEFFEPSPGRPDEGFVVLDEVFHLEAQLAAARGGDPAGAEPSGGPRDPQDL